MPLKIKSKAFIPFASMACILLLIGIVFAEPVKYFYDELNRLERVVYPDDTYIKYTYDKLGNITSKEMYWTPQYLTVQKNGTGNGTVTSNPARIQCGPQCTTQTEQFQQGSQVTLKATPDDISTFAGWSGAGCGTGASLATINGTTVVTATFNPIMYTLTVAKSGGSGATITSSDEGINCGPTCSESLRKGTTVTLSVAPDDCTTFIGWSDAACPGTGTCTVTMSEAKTVTALFKYVTPTANFTAAPTSDSAPFDVVFTDQSTCATAWSWNFGDSDPNNPNTSTMQNPTRAYRKPGIYSVTLTASNPDGSAQITKNNLISAEPCPNFPAKIGDTYFPSLLEAVNAAVSGDTIRFHAVDLIGPVGINKALTLDGGYNCWYTQKTTGATAIQGNVTVEDGAFTVTMDSILVN